jgi:diguanylate cyclase (GGDEF)-like protein
MKTELNKFILFLEDFVEKASLEGIISLDNFWELFDVERLSYNDATVNRLHKAVVSLCTIVKKRDAELLTCASLDALTGAFNRTFFEKQAEAIVDKSKKEDTPLSVILIDIDNFKSINDTHGHRGGDKVLIALVRIIKRITRANDLVIRFGGDEFIVILVNASCERAELIKDRIYTEIEKWNSHNNINFSVSVGCSTWDKNKKSLYDTVQIADSKMYKDKNTK